MNNKIFYIADCHFSDNLTFKWDKTNGVTESFVDVDARNAAMIERWNAKVTNRDHVYILGDVFSCSEDEARKILKQLHGAKHFIVGNHDRAWLRTIAESKKYSILECCDYKELSDNGRKVILSHYPIAFWNHQHGGAFHVYGHVHNSAEEKLFQDFGQHLVNIGQFPEFRAMNAGSMLSGYEPVTLDELCSRYDVGHVAKEVFRRKREHELGIREHKEN